MRAMKLMPETGCDIPETIFDAIDIGLIILDREQHVRQWNAAFAAMCGIGSTAASGRTLGDLFPGEEAGRLRAAIAAAFELGRIELLDPFATSPIVSSKDSLRSDAGA